MESFTAILTRAGQEQVLSAWIEAIIGFCLEPL